MSPPQMSAPLRGPVEDEHSAGAATESHVRAGERDRQPALLAHRFKVLRRLGVGASGTVYEAHDLATQRKVAVKTLHSVEPHAIYRLKQEARELHGLHHPNVVAFHELIEHEGEWLYTMDYVEGEPFDVATRRKDETPDLKRLLSCLEQLVSGLEAMHGSGKIHRDLKPKNVLVTSDGQLVIIDFGLVRKAAEGDTELGFRGTPAYAAPEQLTGEELTSAVDWYAVGVLLYECLSGRLPFEGPRLELVQSKRALRCRPLLELAPETPVFLAELCMGLLAPNRAERLDGRAILSAIARPLAHAVAAPPAKEELFGREPELSLLGDALQHASEARATLCVLHGPSGIGKTSIVRALLSRLADEESAFVFTSRCYPHERVPFQALDAVVDGLARHLRKLPLARAAGLLTPDVHLLAQMFPALYSVDALKEIPRLRVERTDEVLLRRRAARALADLLEALSSKKPVLIFIDDLHASSGDASDLLEEVLAHASRARTLWIVTSWRADVLSAAPVERREIPVGPIPKEATFELTRALLGARTDTRLEQLIAKESGGHPMHARVLIERALEGGETSTLSLMDSIAARLTALSATDRGIVDMLALAGQPLDRATLLSAFAGADLSDLRRLVRERILNAIAREEGEVSYALYHDQIREVALSRLDDEQARELHARLARAYMRADSGDATPAVTHLLKANLFAEAAHIAEATAHKALSALALRRAAEMFAIAIAHHDDERQRSALEERACTIFEAVGRSREAAEIYARRARAASPDEAFSLERKAMQSFLLAGETALAEQRLTRLAKDVGLTVPRSRWSLRVRTFLFVVRYTLFGIPELVVDRDAIDPNARRRAELAWSAVAAIITDRHRSAYFGLVTLKNAASGGLVAEYFTSALGLCMGVMWGLRRTLRETPSLLERSERLLSSDTNRSHLAAAIATYHMEAGNLIEADAYLRRALDTPDEPGLSSPLQYVHAGLVVTGFWRGELQKLSVEGPAFLAEADRVGEKTFAPFIKLVLSLTHLCRGDVQAARAQVDSVLTHPAFKDHIAQADLWWRTFIELFAGDGDRAFAIASKLPKRRKLDLSVTNLVLGLFARGHAASHAHIRGRSAVVRDCRRRLMRQRHPWARPFGHMLWSAEAALKKDSTVAIEHLHEAERGFEELGMRAFAAAARTRRGAFTAGEAGELLMREGRQKLAALGLSEPGFMSMLVSGPAPSFESRAFAVSEIRAAPLR